MMPFLYRLFHTHQFGTRPFLLNLLGMDNEKNRSVRFSNVLLDAQHSYYGTNADYVVSSDKGFLAKTKVLYDMYDVHTKVVSLDEFVAAIDLFDDSVLDPTELYRLVIHDLKHGFVERTHVDINSGVRIFDGKLSCWIFSYFNSFTLGFNDESTWVVLYKRSGSVRQVKTFREIASVANKAIAVFGIDIDFRGDFLVEEETELSIGEWRGRRWRIAGIDNHLCMDQRTGELCLRIEFSN